MQKNVEELELNLHNRCSGYRYILPHSSPNVSSLEIGESLRKKILLVNVSSLSDAKLDFDPLNLNMLTDLLLSTWHVKNLTVGFRCIQTNI
ncbi:hypothetical protein F0562_019017 [Nyssa sinensis]|uniref:Uncharacterized protein n=1 Tax=Nyssa sinensis TaxID=561372 RepID=A0A5J4ZC61_9ASTE|nr:hypothetical protein F0562_019017 [Nyssa sinensis]